MSKHTPGPWSAEMYPSGGFEIESNTHGRRGGLFVIASRNSHSNVAAMHANARLIAAAPDLLLALKLAVRQNDHDMVMTGEELRVAYAAIAKATGEQA